MTTKKQRVAAGVSAGIAAGLAAAGAGYYFYGSEDAKKHRQSAAKWAQNLKREVVKEVKRLKKIDSKQVAGVVDEVAGAYATVRGLKAADLEQAAKELKSNWQKLKAELKPAAKKRRKAVNK
ncbi:MAG: hypothetical protein KBC48_00265 [Candidatus Pacebacteria bacterium]|nr:hypothetical protein [Candidatus Paceibacterota bacterium]